LILANANDNELIESTRIDFDAAKKSSKGNDKSKANQNMEIFHSFDSKGLMDLMFL